MIISASRRTDIPALYADWLVRRSTAGSVRVANPYNAKQVREISLRPEDVDAFVFWTKNPMPLMRHEAFLKAHTWLMQYTLNDYPDLEPGLPPLASRIAAFQALSARYGPERMNWRYDPVVLCDSADLSEHRRRFERIACALQGFTRTVTISLVDEYAGFVKRFSPLGYRPFDRDLALEVAGSLKAVADRYGMTVSSCAEPFDLTPAGVEPGRCVDGERLSRIAGHPLRVERDPHQRAHCLCQKSVDIGRYGTCTNGCLYCYANRGRAVLSPATGDSL